MKTGDTAKIILIIITFILAVYVVFIVISDISEKSIVPQYITWPILAFVIIVSILTFLKTLR